MSEMIDDHVWLGKVGLGDIVYVAQHDQLESLQLVRTTS
jgi:hypothetical protein